MSSSPGDFEHVEDDLACSSGDFFTNSRGHISPLISLRRKATLQYGLAGLAVEGRRRGCGGLLQTVVKLGKQGGCFAVADDFGAAVLLVNSFQASIDVFPALYGL